MEVDTVYSATGDNKIDRENICQMTPSQQDARVPDGAIQAQPDGATMGSNTAVCPINQKPFPFLRLPPEIRNMVYQYPRIYRTDSVELRSRGIRSSNLRQPPITRVNRQLRYETLPVFYDIGYFAVELTNLPGNDDDANQNRDHIYKMLFASIPGPDNTLQANNLRFLSYLDFSIETWSSSFWGLAKVGFIMSSSPFVFESDEWDEEYGVVETAGLDWDDTEDVITAFCDGINSSMICKDGRELLGLPGMLCKRAYAAAVEMAALMCSISRQLPQLTSNVLAYVEADDWLDNELAEARQYLMESDESE